MRKSRLADPQWPTTIGNPCGSLRKSPLHIVAFSELPGHGRPDRTHSDASAAETLPPGQIDTVLVVKSNPIADLDSTSRHKSPANGCPPNEALDSPSSIVALADQAPDVIRWGLA